MTNQTPTLTRRVYFGESFQHRNEWQEQWPIQTVQVPQSGANGA